MSTRTHRSKYNWTPNEDAILSTLTPKEAREAAQNIVARTEKECKLRRIYLLARNSKKNSTPKVAAPTTVVTNRIRKVVA